MTSFWSLWIIILTVVTLVGITWLLFANRKTTKSGDNPTTGHVYDGIEEYDNPLPAWWFYMFVISIVFGVIYLILFPGFGSFKGVLNWTSQGQWEASVEKADAKYNAIFSKYAGMPVEALLNDKKALKMGRRIFANNCAQCHGSDGRGAYGIPNLTDQEWLYGDSVEAIKHAILHGRSGLMPAWAGVLSTDQINELTSALLQSADAKPQALLESITYKQYCQSCHGHSAEGNTAVGAPSLVDDIWLYGKSESQIQHTLLKGRNGQMPKHRDLITADKIHLLTAYVKSLSQTDSP